MVSAADKMELDLWRTESQGKCTHAENEILQRICQEG